MSGAVAGIDPALLAEFIDESLEMLSSVDGQFVALEAAPSNLDLVQSIFRPIHSIKGNSAFFGCNRVKALAHELENILDRMRKGKLKAGAVVIGTLLEGVDELRAMLARARSGGPEVDDESRFSALIDKAAAASTETGAGPKPAGVSDNLLAVIEDIYAECVAAESPWCDRLSTVVNELRALKGSAQSVPTDSTGRGQLPPPAQAILDMLAQPMESLLPDAPAKQVGGWIRELADLAADDEQRAIAADLLDTYTTFMAAVGFDALVRDVVLEKTRALVDRGKWRTAAPTAVREPAPPPPEREKSNAASDTQKTMRVSEAHIDTFLAYVGELVVLGDMFNHLQTRVAGIRQSGAVATDFRRANESFADLSNNLQNSIMSIRKVPMRVLLQKVPRLVRDVAARNGKDIRVEVLGEDIEIDKSLLEVLDAPLTHMVRNAADHGIESPDERHKHAKSPQGALRVTASESSTDLVLSITDDGKGIDREALRTKAESLGIVAPGAPMTENDLIALLFRSGVSTAQTITDVSGRGVGMDVVKSNIESVGGRITVDSVPGKGSTFAVRLPKSVTTQIINGFVVYCGGQPFVLPLDRVHETIHVAARKIESIAGRGRCVLHHGELLTVVSLHDALSCARIADAARDGETLVSVQGKHGRYAIGVDSVLGVRKLVLKTVDGLLTTASFVAGAALMGDGAIALVLGLDDLLASGRHSELSSNGDSACRRIA